MKKSYSQLKDTARARLLGNYGALIAAAVVAGLILLLFDIPFSRMLTEGIQYLAISRIIIGYIGSLVIALVAMLIGASMSSMHLKVARQQEIRFSDILYCIKNRPDRYLKYGLVVLIINNVCILPGLICSIASMILLQSGSNSTAIVLSLIGAALEIVGAILDLILVLSLSMGVFLLLDHPELTVRGAMRQSMQMMKGNKWRLFVLILSFIGWFLLGLLTLGLGYLWITQYVSQTETQFYLDLKNQGTC